MEENLSHEITQLLQAWGQGDEAALAQLAPLIEAELHRLAQQFLYKERQGHSLQATELVNEAFLRLIDWQNIDWQNRAQFVGIAAGIMRHVLVDHARRRQNRKHGGDWLRVSLTHVDVEPQQADPEIIALHDALNELAKMDVRQSRIVELRFFGGLTEAEIAQLLELSERQVRRDWSVARAWLFRTLNNL
ncbi:MAG TPA: ECF-type sigma factor [Blastocatellia bacterium]|nr:ECF-type sigma factor [Blastocatellia bacterium]